ncbi:ATP-binding protein [Aestuariibius sp. 2305UL40-4]|uniref:sensor histidine kinase n=1 Tax=Aestuariibius violaceus TaxID=3234132 RepID=UPI00345E1194
MSRAAPSLAQVLTRRLVLLAVVVFLLNSLAVGIYYGSDLRGLESEVFTRETERLRDALEGDVLPDDNAVRVLYAMHPDAYAFALVDRGGTVVDAMNPGLIPPSATDVFADDWFTRLDTPDGYLVVAGQEFAQRQDGLRVVFVMASDPARLLWHAFVDEFYEHVWLPILPLVLLLIGANIFLIRRGLAPIAAAAEWARNLRPGAPAPQPPTAQVPAEIADLIDATQRSLDRLTAALAAEKRHAAEAAHALRTPVAVLVARLDGLPPGETTDRLRADLSALSRTVQQVLASSRADVLTVGEHVAVNLGDIAESTTAALAPFAYSKGIELSLALPDDPVMAQSDAEGVELALSNLIENAILHGGVGPVEIAVGPGATLRVRDHGPGLPPEAECHLFRPFWRGEGAVPGGAGLGLAIVDRLQRAQGGRVEARSATGGGAEFILSFPSAEI